MLSHPAARGVQVCDGACDCADCQDEEPSKIVQAYNSDDGAAIALQCSVKYAEMGFLEVRPHCPPPGTRVATC